MTRVRCNAPAMHAGKNHMKGGRQKSPPPLPSHRRSGDAADNNAGSSATLGTVDDGFAAISDPDHALGAVFDLRPALVQRNGMYYLAGDQHPNPFETQPLLLQQQQPQHVHQPQLQLHQHQHQSPPDDDVVAGISDLRHESLNQLLRQSIEIDHKSSSASARKFRDSRTTTTDDDDDANNNNNNNNDNNSVRNDCGSGNHGDELEEDESFVVS